MLMIVNQMKVSVIMKKIFQTVPNAAFAKSGKQMTLGTSTMLSLSNGQCSKCRHWTHLKYCSNVSDIRRGDDFFCPCCQQIYMVACTLHSKVCKLCLFRLVMEGLYNNLLTRNCVCKTLYPNNMLAPKDNTR